MDFNNYLATNNALSQVLKKSINCLVGVLRGLIALRSSEAHWPGRHRYNVYMLSIYDAGEIRVWIDLV